MEKLDEIIMSLESALAELKAMQGNESTEEPSEDMMEKKSMLKSMLSKKMGEE